MLSRKLNLYRERMKEQGENVYKEYYFDYL